MSLWVANLWWIWFLGMFLAVEIKEMAWTTPKTWERGEAVTVESLNECLLSNLDLLGFKPSVGPICDYCGGKRSADGMGQCKGCGAPLA